MNAQVELIFKRNVFEDICQTRCTRLCEGLFIFIHLNKDKGKLPKIPSNFLYCCQQTKIFHSFSSQLSKI